MQNQSKLLNEQLDAIYDPPNFDKGIPYFPTDTTTTQSPSSSGINYLHYHDDLEIGYCYSGSGIFIVNDLIIPYQSPCACIIYKNLLHIAQSSSSQPSEWVFLNIDTNAFFNEDSEMIGCICPVPNFGQSYIITPDSPVLLQHIHDFIEELRHKNSNYLKCAKYLLLSALIEHARQNRFIEGNDSRQWLFKDIAVAISYISNHYDQQITVEFLAKLCNVSTATLRRKFNQALNLSPLDYLHQVRISTAVSMLMLDNKSILEICNKVGYNSQSSFNRQFLKITGKSPMKYRT